MNWLGIFFIILGLSYLIYSIMNKDKITFYFTSINIVKGKEEEYFKLQLYFAILNALIIIIVGLIAVIYNIDPLFLVMSTLIVHFVNYIFKTTSKIKGYRKA